MKSKIKPVSCESCYICTRRHKFFAWVALIGIFVCGVMVGVSLWGYKHVRTADSGKQGLVEYVKNTVESSPCKMREHALIVNLGKDIDDRDTYSAIEEHIRNAKIYEMLANYGCAENVEDYNKKRLAEEEIAKVLQNMLRGGSRSEQPCQIIESTLLERIDTCETPDCHLGNAEVYSKMVEDGCPENQQKYAQKALDELQIADGVRINDTDVQRNEIRSKVNTYKKLQMQNEARKYINKVEKLVNPGVDFIMELQRVIEE